MKLTELHSSIDIDGMVVDPPLSPTHSTATMRSRKRKQIEDTGQALKAAKFNTTVSSNNGSSSINVTMIPTSN